MSDEIIQDSTKRLVPSVYYEMLYLRFMGLTYDQIAKKTNYSHSRVRALFAKNGVLHDLYREWLETAKKNSMEEALDMMFAHLPDIIRARIMHAESMGMGSNEAAKIILNYTLGNPERPLTQNNIQINNFVISDEKKEQIKKAFSNFKILKQNGNDNERISRGNNEQPGIKEGSG